MFQTIALISILSTASLILLHFLLRGRKIKATRHGMGRLPALVYLFLLISFLGLALTAFIPALCGQRLAGYLLLLHCTIAPPFAILFALFVFIFAPQPGHDSLQRLLFWAAALLGLASIASILFTMTPLFGQAGQLFLFQSHRYTALALSLIMAVYAYRRALLRPEVAASQSRVMAVTSAQNS